MIQKHKIIVYVNSLLGLIIVIFLARVFLRPSLPESAHAYPLDQVNQPQPNGSLPSDEPTSSDASRYDGIIQRDLFQTNPSDTHSAATSEVAPKPSDPPKLNLTLKGTIAGPPSIARALIQNADTGNQTELHKIGDLIGNATLLQIDPDSATILYHGKKHRITITKNASIQNETPKPLFTSKKITENTSPSGRISRFFEDFISAIDMEPYEINGQSQGMKITQLKENRSADFLGIKQGDIIQKVNGQNVTSKQKAFQIFQKAKTQPALHIELVRDQKNITRTFQLH